MGKKKCQAIFGDHGDISEDVVKNIKKAVEYHGLKFYNIDTSGDFFALMVCKRNSTKQDAKKEYRRRMDTD